MKTSSASQLELDNWDEIAPPVPGRGSKMRASGRTGDKSTSTTTPSFPDFGTLGAEYAAAARLAGRINASSASDSERSTLLAERQALLDKLFSGSITAREKNRLEYVRWSLDRIEDAEHGYVLDALESAISTYEQLQSKIQEFEEQLEQQRQDHLRRQRQAEQARGARR